MLMHQDIDKTLITRQQIATRLDELAQQMIADHDRPTELTLIPILTGSFIFVADLIRRLPIRMQIRVMSISSYPGQATQSRGTQVEAALTRIPDCLKGRHVIVIDDILDTGQTLLTARDLLAEKQPDSLKTCVLLRKQRPEPPVIEADYVAFDVPDLFVVGYGLDHNDYYRNLPEIVQLKSHVFQEASP